MSDAKPPPVCVRASPSSLLVVEQTLDCVQWSSQNFNGLKTGDI